MQTFTDKTGRTWQVEFTAHAIEQLLELLGFDVMLAIKDEREWSKLQDAETIVNVIYVVCKAQADARGVTDEQFGQLLAAEDVFPAAVQSLVKASCELQPAKLRAETAAAADRIFA